METQKSKRNIKAFDGEKYSIWKFRVRALLNEMEVLNVIDEDPKTSCSQWQKNNRTAKGIIVEYLSDSYLGFARDETTAKEIFRNLDALYERKSIATQLALRKKLLVLKLQGDTTLVRHFAIFDDLITELLAAGAKLEETDKIAHLLLTLPTSYDGIITAIETLSEDSLTLAFVKTRLLDHEVKLRNDCADTSSKVLHVNVDNKTQSFKKNNNNILKQNNFKNNHYRNKLWKNTHFIKCHHCGRKGHLKKNCFHYKKSTNQQKYNNENKTRTIQNVNTIQSSKPDEFSGFAFMTGMHKHKDQSNKITFLLDSGASDHIINRDDLFSTYTTLTVPLKISVAKNSEFISATKSGTLQVTSNMGIQGELEDVLYCRDVPYNLLSVSKMQQAGLSILFEKDSAQIIKDGNVLMSGKLSNNLIVLDFVASVNKCQSVSQVCKNYNNIYSLWHQRLGHMSKNKFLQLKNYNMIEDINQISTVTPTNDLCESCINGKQSRLPFNKGKDKSHIKRPLFIVHSDVCGPITPSTVDNKNYFVLFVDHFTHYCVTYIITYKSDVFATFKDFIAKSEAKFNTKLVNLYCDNGGEYLSTEMKSYCVEKGITYHLTVPRTPQLNGVSERMVRTITEKARSMINGAKLDKQFWGEAVLTAVYLINITPTRALKLSQTPYEMWHGVKPKVKYLKVFGSTVYVHIKTNKNKFDEKSWKGILVGYEPNGYKVWNPEIKKFVLVRDVIVDELDFVKSRPKVNPEEDILNSHGKTDICNNSKSVLIKSRNSDCNKSDMAKSDGEAGPHKPQHDIIEMKKSNSESNTESLNSEPRRSDRLKGRELHYRKYGDDYLMCAQSVVSSIPSSYAEIKSLDDRDQWEHAVKDELDALYSNKTWTLVPKPENKNIVDCKWIFSIKTNEFGKPVRYKARLVARGFSQEYLTDYNETFAPVARMSSFRFIIAFANQFNLLIHHMDVKTAFLNGDLKEEIFMKIPEGVNGKDNYVCKLNKALYGLKQAARCWFEVFDCSLKEKGFQNSEVDRCIYFLDRGSVYKNIYVVLYVDDLVIACADIDTLSGFKNYLMSKFKMTDLKDINYFLGIKVTRYNDKILLDQSAYIKIVLNKFKMHDCNPVKTPLENKLNFEALNSNDKYDAPCRNVIGCLMYIMLCTRPDLSTSVNILSRYTNKSNIELWQCLKRVLRYLKGTTELKLCYERCDTYNDILCGYVDSDWGGNDTQDRKSTTGFLFKLFDVCTITWNTKKQMSVAASSTEAEYMALYEAVREALWLRSLAVSINIKIDKPITIYEDNNGCISIASNPTSHKRSKHIDIKYHFSREQVEKNIIKLNYIPTGNQIADAMTKPLPATTFQIFRSKMGLE